MDERDGHEGDEREHDEREHNDEPGGDADSAVGGVDSVPAPDDGEPDAAGWPLTVREMAPVTGWPSPETTRNATW